MPTDANLRQRLANLQGVPNKEYNNFDLIKKVETRSEEEQTRDLLTQFMEERNIDEAGHKPDAEVDPIKEIERRLAALKGIPEGAEDREALNRENEDTNVTVGKIVDQVKRQLGIYRKSIFHRSVVL